MRFHKKKKNGEITNELAVCQAPEGECPNGGSGLHINAENIEDAYRKDAEGAGLSVLLSNSKKLTEEEEQQKWHQEYIENRDKNVNITLETLQPREFETDSDGNVVIPDDVREELKKEIDAGYITPAESEDGQLVMLKYSKSAMYDQKWNDTTVNFRGVLTDPEYKRVYARGFTKFFNVSEHESRSAFPDLPKEEQIILAKKMDGSLGLITNVDGENRVFTSGSSRKNDIAVAGENILKDKLGDENQEWQPPKNVTVLAEIIDPDVNPIVVEYNKKNLVVLGAVDNKTGKDVPVDSLNIPLDKVEKINDGKSMSYQEAITQDIPENEEGYVLEFQNSGLRAKVKGEDYLQAHRVITNMSAKSLWRSIVDKKDDEMLETVKKVSPDRAYLVTAEARNKMKKELNDKLEEREKVTKIALARYNMNHNDGKFVTSANGIPEGKMKNFVEELRKVHIETDSTKSDFSIDISLAKGNRDHARKSVLRNMEPYGNLSISSLISAEKSEIGDDADDQK